MSRIRSVDTKPEKFVRKYLFSRGLRYRKNDKRYPGKPDLVFPKYKTMVFVNGCFWHGHKDCMDFIIPKSNTDYWLKKIAQNIDRDSRNILLLNEAGWKTIILWECELKPNAKYARLALLYNEIIVGIKLYKDGLM